MADDLTPGQLEVLRLVCEDRLEANLTDKQYAIREELEEAGYVYFLGDDYDVNIYLTDAGKEALDQVDPQWWVGEYKRRQREVKKAREGIEAEKGRAESYVAHLRREIVKLEKQIADEVINAPGRLAQVIEDAAKAETDFRAWVEAHKDKLGAKDG